MRSDALGCLQTCSETIRGIQEFQDLFDSVLDVFGYFEHFWILMTVLRCFWMFLDVFEHVGINGEDYFWRRLYETAVSSDCVFVFVFVFVYVKFVCDCLWPFFVPSYP